MAAASPGCKSRARFELAGQINTGEPVSVPFPDVIMPVLKA
jgi:hypothetical protein